MSAFTTDLAASMLVVFGLTFDTAILVMRKFNLKMYLDQTAVVLVVLIYS